MSRHLSKPCCQASAIVGLAGERWAFVFHAQSSPTSCKCPLRAVDFVHNFPLAKLKICIAGPLLLSLLDVRFHVSSRIPIPVAALSNGHKGTAQDFLSTSTCGNSSSKSVACVYYIVHVAVDARRKLTYDNAYTQYMQTLISNISSHFQGNSKQKQIPNLISYTRNFADPAPLGFPTCPTPRFSVCMQHMRIMSE